MTTNPTYVRRTAPLDALPISRKPIAFVPDSWSLTEKPTEWQTPEGRPNQKGSIWYARLDVIAVRGTKNQPKITIGTIGDSFVTADWRTDEVPQTPEDFMAAWDNRYGVSAVAVGDNPTRIWTADPTPDPASVALYRTVIGQVLRGLPAVPSGYSGWWLQYREGK